MTLPTRDRAVCITRSCSEKTTSWDFITHEIGFIRSFLTSTIIVTECAPTSPLQVTEGAVGLLIEPTEPPTSVIIRTNCIVTPSEVFQLVVLIDERFAFAAVGIPAGATHLSVRILC